MLHKIYIYTQVKYKMLLIVDLELLTLFFIISQILSTGTLFMFGIVPVSQTQGLGQCEGL